MNRWRTKDGKYIAYEDMETSHIKNSIAMLKRSHGKKTIIGDVGFDASDCWADEIIIDNSKKIEQLEKELNKRINSND